MIAKTDYHAKYFAWELTKRSASDSMQKLASTLVDARVDLRRLFVNASQGVAWVVANEAVKGMDLGVGVPFLRGNRGILMNRFRFCGFESGGCYI